MNDNIFFSIRSRILVAEKGIELLASIDSTIDKYGEMTANELVELTHKDGSPWSRSGSGLELYRYIEKLKMILY